MLLRYSSYAFVSVAIILVHGINAQTSCSDRINLCIGNLADDFVSVTTNFVPIIDVQTLDSHCSGMTAAFNCIDAFIFQCLEFSASLEANRAAYDWLCGNGKSGYIQHAPCFRSPDINSIGAACRAVYDQQNTQSDAAACQAYNTFINCYHDGVEETCGETAADWMWQFDVRLLQAELPGCTLQPTDGVASPDVCTQSRIDMCFSGLEEDHFDVVGAIVPILELSDLNSHCRDINRALSCVDDFVRTCDVTYQREHRGVTAAYGWLCGDGETGYIRHAQCFRSQSIHDEGERCSTVYNSRISTARTESQACRYSNEYINCYHDEVEDTCGSDAADWIWEFDFRLLQPIVPSCTLTPGGDGSGGSSSAAITHPLLTLPALAMTLFFLRLF